jgi:hypothetical protein
MLEVLRKNGTRVRSNKVTILNGGEASFFSLRQAITYLAKARAARRLEEDYAVAFSGFSFRGRPVASADRRRVGLTVTQDATSLLGWKKQPAWDEKGNETTLEVPNLLTTSTTATLQVDDGGLVLLPVHFQTAKAKDRVTVLLVQPHIYIEEEEQLRKKQAR